MIGGTATRADATGETIDVIEAEFRRMAAEGPTEDELAKAKTYLKGSFALNLDTSTKIASQLVQMQIDNLGIDYIERRSALIDAVTLADARRVAKRLLGWRPAGHRRRPAEGRDDPAARRLSVHRPNYRHGMAACPLSRSTAPQYIAEQAR